MSTHGIGDIDQSDIFSNLDVSLLELLHRRRIEELFLNASADERISMLNEQMDTPGQEIDDGLIERQILYLQQRNHIHRSMFFWVWIGGVLPLPAFRYRDFYRNFSTRRMLDVIAAFVFTLWQRFFFMMSWFAFGFLLFNYLPKLFQVALLVGNQFTFSDNFFRDTLTYIFRDNSAMLERHNLILMNDCNVFTGIDIDGSLLNTIFSLTYNVTCRYLMSYFFRFGEESVVYIDNRSLVFKFGDVVNDSFPTLESYPWFGTLVTVSVYLLYTALGILIFININWFYAANFLNRLSKYKRFFFRIVKIVWRSLFSEVL